MQARRLCSCPLYLHRDGWVLQSGVQFENSLFVFEEGNADDTVIGGNSDDIGDLANSYKEGQEADIFNDGLNLRTMLEGSNKAIGNDANNIDPFHGRSLETKALKVA